MRTIRHHSIHKAGGIGASAMLLLSLLNSAHAASGTWTGTTDNTWQTSSNWDVSPFPGATSGFSSANIATFAAAGGGTIDLGGTINVHSIVFGPGGGNAGGFIIGDADDTLNLTGAGRIVVNGGVTTNQIIGASGGTLNLSSTNNSTYSFQNFGSGSLNIAGAVTANQATGNTSVLTLGGSGNGTIAGALTNAGSAGSSGLALVKNGSGTWTLSGANTYSGTTTINGGQLTLDYSANTPTNSSSQLAINGGTLAFKGQTSGTTTTTVESLALGSATLSANTLTLDSNGGSGVGLTIGTLSGVNRNNLIDYSSHSDNSITVNALSGLITSGSSNVLMTGGVGNYRANNIVRDADGYGFATLSGATSGTLGRLSTGTALTASNTSSSTNYRLTTPGTLTRTAGLDFLTLTIDTTGGAITLDMADKNLILSSGGGRSILITGSNDATITGTGVIGNAVGVLNNYSTGTFSFSLATATFGTTFAGTGFTDFSGTVTSTGGQSGSGIYITGGITRFSLAQTLPANTPILVEGSVFEIGADLNGVGAGDFTATVSNATTSGISFRTDAGISAAGADRVVNFGGAAATLTWGSSGFLTNVDGTSDGGYTLKLSSARSDAKLTIENGINLGTNTNRVIDVANGSAATDAVLSGVLSGAGANLIKQGEGTLELSAENTYSGATIVAEGTLSLGSTGSLASTAYSIGNGAIFDVSAQSSYSLASVAVTIDVGSSGAGFINGPSGMMTLGDALTINFTTSSFTDGQIVDLFDFSGQTGDFSSVTLSGSISGSLVLSSTDTWTGSFGGYDLTFSESTGALAFAAIPEPSTFALLFGGASLLIVGCSRRRVRSLPAVR